MYKSYCLSVLCVVLLMPSLAISYGGEVHSIINGSIVSNICYKDETGRNWDSNY